MPAKPLLQCTSIVLLRSRSHRRCILLRGKEVIGFIVDSLAMCALTISAERGAYGHEGTYGHETVARLVYHGSRIVADDVAQGFALRGRPRRCCVERLVG